MLKGAVQVSQHGIITGVAVDAGAGCSPTE